MQELQTRIYISVPFEDWKIVKKLGAKWDYINNSWYLIGNNYNSFEKWLDNKNSHEVKA